jgi:hypothetical protein
LLEKKMAQFKNPTLVQRGWGSKFLNKKATTHQTILYNYKKFDRTGSVKYTPS